MFATRRLPLSVMKSSSSSTDLYHMKAFRFFSPFHLMVIFPFMIVRSQFISLTVASSSITCFRYQFCVRIFKLIFLAQSLFWWPDVAQNSTTVDFPTCSSWDRSSGWSAQCAPVTWALDLQEKKCVSCLTCSLRIPGSELRPGTTMRTFSRPLRWLSSISVQMYLDMRWRQSGQL